MPDVGVPLSIVGIGIAILTPFIQYSVKDVPWYVSYGGISLGAGILTFGLLVTFFPPSTLSNEPLSRGGKVLSSTEPNEPLPVAQSTAGDDDNDSPLRWPDHLEHEYSSSVDGTTVYTHAIRISASNVSTHEIHLEDAYIVSGETGEKIPLKVGAVGAGWILPRETNPIPPNGTVTLRAEFAAPAGLAANDLFNRWKVMHLTAKYDGEIHRKLIDEKMVAAIYSSFRPSPIGPRVTKRHDQ